jgi:cyclic pyranopterin phosphate synthase
MSKPRKLTHLDQEGKAHMVDVSEKKTSAREARARAFVRLTPAALEVVAEGDLPKGDVFGVARVAGIMAAKKTPELIPLCHPLALTGVEVTLKTVEGGVLIESLVKTTDRTGVEMEALTAASIAALTVYDMCKSIDKSITIESVMLVEKSGGKSGNWKRDG